MLVHDDDIYLTKCQIITLCFQVSGWVWYLLGHSSVLLADTLHNHLRALSDVDLSIASGKQRHYLVSFIIRYSVAHLV